MKQIVVALLLTTAASAQTFHQSLAGPWPMTSYPWDWAEYNGTGTLPSPAGIHVDGTWNSPYPQTGTFTADSSGTTLTVTSPPSLPLVVGQWVYGPGVTGTPTITAFGTGSGSEGTYTLSTAETLSDATVTNSTCPQPPPGSAWQIQQNNVSWKTENGNATLIETVPAGTCNAGEIETDSGNTFMGGTGSNPYPWGATGYSYGYYAATIRTGYGPANGIVVPGATINGNGTVLGFFLKADCQGAEPCGSLGNLEIDVEFLSNGPWDVKGSNTGIVYFTVNGNSGDNVHVAYNLPFNPSATYHRYGIDWQPGTVTWYVDGKVVYTANLADATDPGDGVLILANQWAGNENYGGNAPLKSVAFSLRNIDYYAGATSPPAGPAMPSKLAR